MNAGGTLSCIIRSVGERTTGACTALLHEALGKDIPFRIVQVQPFTEALRQTIRTGMELACTWMLVIDADVLISRAHLRTFLELRARLPADAFMLHACVWDKLFGRARWAGNRLYRTSLLACAEPFVGREGENPRPEATLCHRMKEKGYRIFKSPLLIGLHDYEQGFEDILCKTVLFGRKHSKHGARLKAFWEQHRDDPDYAAALDGLAAAPSDDSALVLDRNLLGFCPEEVRRFWQERGKPPLHPSFGQSATVSALLKRESGELGDVKADLLVEYKK